MSKSKDPEAGKYKAAVVGASATTLALGAVIEGAVAGLEAGGIAGLAIGAFWGLSKLRNRRNGR
jgi:hypothetical protein